MAYLIATTVMTLSVLEGHSPNARLFKRNILYFVPHRVVSLHLQSFLWMNL